MSPILPLDTCFQLNRKQRSALPMLVSFPSTFANSRFLPSSDARKKLTRLILGFLAAVVAVATAVVFNPIIYSRQGLIKQRAIRSGCMPTTRTSQRLIFSPHNQNQSFEHLQKSRSYHVTVRRSLQSVARHNLRLPVSFYTCVPEEKTRQAVGWSSSSTSNKIGGNPSAHAFCYEQKNGINGIHERLRHCYERAGKTMWSPMITPRT